MPNKIIFHFDDKLEIQQKAIQSAICYRRFKELVEDMKE